jgi:aryl-alcohol dehydrogenase-like predicted oxidoreductase
MYLTRRELIELGITVLAAGGAGRRAFAAQPAALVTKRIPATGERVPVIGLGTRNYRAGSEPTELVPYRETLKAFLEAGGTVIDTAPSYGNSESILGGLIAELGARSKIFLASKVDRDGKDAGIARMNASFANLKVERMDLMQVHNLNDTATQLATLREWKDAGKIRLIGVTTSSDRQYAELERIMNREKLDFIQIDYALDARDADARVLPLAADKGIGVLINLPFGRGRLFQALGTRPLPDYAKEIECTTCAQFALKYVVSHPAVTCAIPGMTKAHHAVDNMGAARGHMPDAAMRKRMEQVLA